MPLFSSKLELTNAASSSGVALSNIEFTRGAFYAVEKVSDLASIPVDRIAHDQIVWVESASATYQASLFVADYVSIFEDSASWGVFTGFGSGGGGATNIGDLADVSTASLDDGDVLAWNAASSSWKPTNVSGTGDISAVFAGDGLSGGGTQGSVSLDVDAGDGINITSAGVSLNTGSSHFYNAIDARAASLTSFNSFTSSIETEVDSLQAATSSYVTLSQTSSMTVLSASYAVSASIEILTEISSSHAEQADTASFVSDTFISQSALRSGFGSGTDLSSLNTFTGSIQTEVNSIKAATSSYALITDISGSFTSTSSSLASRITSQEAFSSSLDATFATEAELNASTASLSSSLAVDISSNTTTNTTQDSRLTSIEAATGSYILASQTSSMTVLSASYAISSSVEILTEISSSHAVQADTASFITDLFISQSAARSGFSSIDTSIFALTGSDYTTTNNIQITGSLTLQLDTEGDTLAIYSGSEKRFSITNQGVLVLTTQSSEPTATKGGMYLDSNYDLYIGQD